MLPEQLPFDIQPSVLGSLSVSISTSHRYPFIVFVCFSIVCMCWLVGEWLVLVDVRVIRQWNQFDAIAVGFMSV